jgi:hypothetical protein
MIRLIQILGLALPLAFVASRRAPQRIARMRPVRPPLACSPLIAPR